MASILGLRAGLKAAKLAIEALEEERQADTKASRDVRRKAGEMSLYEFVKSSWHVLHPPEEPFIDNWHLGCICEHLEACTSCEILKLIINIPPGHAKSIIVCVMWFAWVWSLNPYSRWICTSYSDSLVNRDALKCRDLVTSHWYQDKWGDKYKMRGDQNAKEKIQNDKHGYRIATTTGGRAGGERCDYFVSDDALKLEEGSSKVARDRVNDWWSNTVVSRGADPKKFRMVAIAQRLHERDLSGYLVAEVGGYEHLVLPAEYEPKRYWFMGSTERKPKDAIIPTVVQKRSKTACDPRHEPGELLWPARYDRAAVENQKKEMRHNAAGQLQQRPTDASGTIFRRQCFRYFTARDTVAGPVVVLLRPEGGEHIIPLRLLRFFQTADTATKIKKRNDYTAVVTAACAPGGHLLIFHVVQAKIEVPHLRAWLEALKAGPCQWDYQSLIARPTGQKWPKPIMKQYVEDANSGAGILQTAKAHGNPMGRLSPTGDKIEKSAALATLYENGSVWHLAAAPWVAEFEDEITSFPNAAHDDRTDAAAHAGQMATRDILLRSGWENLEDVAKDYPEYAAAKAEEERKAAEEMKEAILLASGMMDPGTAAAIKAGRKRKEEAERQAEEDKKPLDTTYKIRIGDEDLEIPDD